ncbi:GNAT family N-acetyltransferase [Thalassobacillus pellis]|uniref:GNAT family N-acetyltransferase n=1 Tax=Thalassobacillus pellis TaxID=748008 RepID=UPI00196039D8|nr:GNAT family N-acetyltransferase [Thalassobacillus pellis]MBM7552262.1 RimJ/RimL family protein N-acetyltransferase [Thalassobacillus pellis]
MSLEAEFGVKILRGNDYAVIEEAEKVPFVRFEELIYNAKKKLVHEELKKIVLVLEGDLDRLVLETLKNEGFQHTKKRCRYEFDFQKPFPFPLDRRICLQSIDEIGETAFLSLWEQAAGRSQAKRDYTSLKSELGKTYKRSCYGIILEDKGIGIALPHIEPGTEQEGRLFFIGLIPAFRGKGFGVEAHRHALYILKERFLAENYVGMTDEDNLPMKQIFYANHCIKTSDVNIFTYEI